MNLRVEQKEESISRLRALVSGHGGEILDTPRIDSQNRSVRLSCRRGHNWTGDFFRTLNGTWCPKCASSDRLRVSYDKILALVEQRQGECLTPFEEYRGINLTRMKFRCTERHEWIAGPLSLINGHWCNTCSSLKRRNSLTDVKAAAEKYGYTCLSTKYSGYKAQLRFRCPAGHEVLTRPATLLCRGIRCMECFLGGKKSKMLSRLQTIAKANRGRMVSLAYTGWDKPHVFECERGHQWSVAVGGVANGAWCQTCYFEDRTLGIEALQAEAKSKRGESLAKVYLGTQVPHRWRCAKGHEFELALNRVKAGSWCRICQPTRNSKRSIEQMQVLAKKKGGTCLSKVYINSQTFLRWECANGHRFQSKPNWVQQGIWCSTCGGRSQK